MMEKKMETTNIGVIYRGKMETTIFMGLGRQQAAGKQALSLSQPCRLWRVCHVSARRTVGQC